MQKVSGSIPLSSTKFCSTKFLKKSWMPACAGMTRSKVQGVWALRPQRVQGSALAAGGRGLERDELSLTTLYSHFGEQFHGSVDRYAIRLQAILLYTA